MRKLLKIVSVFALLALANSVFAGPEVGKPAPDFVGVDSNGKEVALADLRGKTVVLEWTNEGCPYVKKHYKSDNMQTLQKEAVADDVVWVSVISSAPGKQGYVTPEEGNAIIEKYNASPTHLVLDPEGTIGRAYDARTTPHMYVIDAEGELVYMGGIDDKPTTSQADIEGANNYVRAALTDLKNDKPVATPATRPYGCSVKYSS